MTYYTIVTDGTIHTQSMYTPKGARPTLGEIQLIVGGLIERVRMPGGEMWVNEEGLLIGLPVNVLASCAAGQYIVGNVLVCMRKQRTKKA